MLHFSGLPVSDRFRCGSMNLHNGLERSVYDKRNDYARNKGDPQAIVYASVTGRNVRLTCSDFESKEQFAYWKKWSDDDYKNSEKAGRWYDDCTVPIRTEADTDGVTIEDMLITDKTGVSSKLRTADTMKKIRDILTETQYRRLYMFYGERMQMTLIALSEGISQPAVSKSIRSARKKLRKILKKRL